MSGRGSPVSSRATSPSTTSRVEPCFWAAAACGSQTKPGGGIKLTICSTNGEAHEEFPDTVSLPFRKHL